MATIVPRWEWRTFGPGVAVGARHLAGVEPTGIQESDEVYLLSPGRDTAKIRDGLMDLKVLVATDADGLEQWRPAMKAAFPLSAADVEQALGLLGVAVPPLTRDVYSLDEFLAEVAGPHPDLRPVDVHKRRVRYRIGGCTSEVTDVTADGLGSRTLAIESEDAAAVVGAVRSIGLGDWCNTSYGIGLSRIVQASPERYAIVDCGTNSIKFHVGERRADGEWHALVDRAEITRLGEGLEETGEIADAAVERAATAIAGMAAEARDLGALAVAAVGTAGLRIASNQAAVVEAIARRSGVHVVVIPGEEEARLAYRAVQAGLHVDRGSLAVFDTGGGSTQLTFGRDGVVEERFSVDVGAVRYTDRFGLGGRVTRTTLDEALATIAADLARLDGRPAPDVVVGMGGAMTNLTAVSLAMATYDPDRVQGATLTRAEIDRQIERYASLDAAGRRGIAGLQPKRADVILAGACVVRTVMDKLGADDVRVSDRGLRHGLLAERFGG